MFLFLVFAAAAAAAVHTTDHREVVSGRVAPHLYHTNKIATTVVILASTSLIRALLGFVVVAAVCAACYLLAFLLFCVRAARAYGALSYLFLLISYSFLFCFSSFLPTCFCTSLPSSLWPVSVSLVTLPPFALISRALGLELLFLTQEA